MRPIIAAEAPANKHYPMIKLITKGGSQITMTSESLFGLVQYNGAPVLYKQRKIAPLAPMRFDAPQVEPFDWDDPRYWYIVGIVTSGDGNLPVNGSRAACVYYHPSRTWEFEIIKQFLDQYFQKFEVTGFIGRYPKTTVTDGPFGVALVSKMINAIANRLASNPQTCVIGPELFSEVNENSIYFTSGMRTAESYAAFMAGVLAGMTILPEGRQFHHRNSRLVRLLNERLWQDFGIPSELIINPHEDVVKWRQRKSVNVHQFIIHREHYLKVQDAGLAHWDQDLLLNGGEQFHVDLVADPIHSVESVGIQRGFVLDDSVQQDHRTISDRYKVWDHFVFRREFAPDAGALDFATMQELFTEVDDPSKIIAQAPVSMASGVLL